MDIKDITEQKGYLIYSRDVVHSHSKAICKLLNFFMNHLEEAFEAKRRGENVILYDRIQPAFIYACGAIPIDMTDIARLGKMDAIRQAEEFFQVPAETCAMVKAKIGGFYNYKDSPCKKVLLGSTSCEPTFAAATLMNSFGYDTCVCDIIQNPVECSEEQKQRILEKYREELQKISMWISGREIDEERLHEELVRAERIRTKTDHLLELQRKHPAYMRALPAMLVESGSRGYYGQPERFEAVIDEIIEEFEALKDNEYNDHPIQIMWSGVRGVDFSVFNTIDFYGGCITGWNIPGSGGKHYDKNLSSLDAYIRYSMGDREAIGMRAASELDEEMFRQSGAAGIILYITQGCTHRTISQEVRRRYLNEKHIPTLALSGAAQIGEATGQVMTRIKAFLEMLS